MGYTEAIDEKLKLLHFWRRLGTHATQIYAEHMLQMKWDEETARECAAVVEEALNEGAPFYVAPPICGLIEHAAGSYPTTPLTKEMIPEPLGFLYFANGMPVTFSSPSKVYPYRNELKTEALRQIYLDALSWAVTEEGLILAYWSKLPARRCMALAWMTAMEWGRSWDKFDSTLRDAVGYNEFLRYLLTTFAFMEQKVLEVKRAEVTNKSARKRMEKEQRGAVPAVRLIQLRRKQKDSAGVEHETKDVEWTCRWLVNGHWRKQWYPTKGEHHPRWIAPYVKGPEDKPLRTGGKVYVVNR